DRPKVIYGLTGPGRASSATRMTAHRPFGYGPDGRDSHWAAAQNGGPMRFLPVRRSASAMVGAVSAKRPIRACARTGSRLVFIVHARQPVRPQPTRAAGSGSGGAN